MSGRAGRRGIDERGMVMMMVDQKLDSLIGKNILKVHLPYEMKIGVEFILVVWQITKIYQIKYH